MKKLIWGTAAAASAMFLASAPAEAASIIQCQSSAANACVITFVTGTTGAFGSYFDTLVDVMPFTDIYEFTLNSSGTLAIGLTTSGINPSSDIDFILSSLTTSSNVPIAPLLPTSLDPNEQYALATSVTAGTYRLQLSGVAGEAAFVAGTYTGTLDFAAGAVPEPTTWILMLTGIGAVGYSLRRRKSYRLIQSFECRPQDRNEHFG